MDKNSLREEWEDFYVQNVHEDLTNLELDKFGDKAGDFWLEKLDAYGEERFRVGTETEASLWRLKLAKLVEEIEKKTDMCDHNASELPRFHSPHPTSAITRCEDKWGIGYNQALSDAASLIRAEMSKKV